MEAVLQALGWIYGIAQQNPITAFAGVGAAIAVLALVMAAKPDGLEKPLLSRRRVWPHQAILGIWTVRWPHRRSCHALRQAQHWLILCREYVGEMCWIVGSTGVGKTTRIIIPALVTMLLRRKKSGVLNDPASQGLNFLWPFLGRVGGHPNVHIISTNPDHPDEICSAVDIARNRDSLERFIQGGLDVMNAADRSWGEKGKAMWVSEWEHDGRPDLPTSYANMCNVKHLDRLAEEYPETFGSHWLGSEIRGSHQDARKQALAPFASLDKPHVLRLFSRGRAGEFAGPLFLVREMVFLVSKDGDQSTDGVMSGTTAEIMHRAITRDDGKQAYEKKSPRVELYIDEGALRFPIARAAEWINTIRKAGVNMLIAVQSIAQVRSKMDHDAADDGLGGGRTMVFGATNDPQSRKFVADLAGTTTIKEHQASLLGRVYRRLSGRDVPRPQRYRVDRFRDEHLRELKRGQVVVFAEDKKPVMVRQKVHWGQWIYRLVLPRKKHQGNIRLMTPANPTPAIPEIRSDQTEAGLDIDTALPSPEEPAPDLNGGGPVECPDGDPEETCRSLLGAMSTRMVDENDIWVSYERDVVDVLLRDSDGDPDQLPDLVETGITERLLDFLANDQLRPGEQITLYVRETGQLSLRRDA